MERVTILHSISICPYSITYFSMFFNSILSIEIHLGAIVSLHPTKLGPVNQCSICIQCLASAITLKNERNWNKYTLFSTTETGANEKSDSCGTIILQRRKKNSLKFNKAHQQIIAYTLGCLMDGTVNWNWFDCILENIWTWQTKRVSGRTGHSFNLSFIYFDSI